MTKNNKQFVKVFSVCSLLASSALPGIVLPSSSLDAIDNSQPIDTPETNNINDDTFEEYISFDTSFIEVMNEDFDFEDESSDLNDQIVLPSDDVPTESIEEEVEQVVGTFPDNFNFIYDIENSTSLKNVFFEDENKLYNATGFFQIGRYFQYLGKDSKLGNDMLINIKNIWENHKDFLNLVNIHTNNFQVSDTLPIFDKEYALLNYSRVSFDFKIEFNSFKDGILEIGNRTFYIEKNTTFDLVIKADNQTIIPGLIFDNRDGKFCLTWNVNEVEISVGEDTWKSSYNVNDSFSTAFNYKFENVTDKKNYLDIFEENQSKINEKLNSKQIEYLLKQQIENNLSKTFDFIDVGMELLYTLNANKSFVDLLRSVVPKLCNALKGVGTIPDFLLDIFSQSIGSSESSYVNFVDFIDKNREYFYDMVENNYPEYSGLAKTFLSYLKPGLTIESPEYIDLKNLIGDNEVLNKIIFSDILGITGSPQPLIQIITDNIVNILSIINIDPSMQPIIEGTSNLLSIIIGESQGSSIFIPIWDAIKLDESTTIAFVNSLSTIMGIFPEIKNIFDILINGNELVAAENIIKFVNLLCNFLSPIFEVNSQWTTVFERYKNLDIKITEEKPVSIKDDGKISFKFKYEIELKKQTVLPLKEIKSWISARSILRLVQIPDSAIKWLPGFVQQIIKDYIIHIIPDYIYLGTRNNATTITFEANNEQVLFKPVKDGSLYNYGYQFNYTTSIFMQDPAIIESITKIYDQIRNRYFLGIGSIDIYYGQLWEDILQNILLRKYETSSRFVGSISNQAVETVSTYDENIYIPGFEFNTFNFTTPEHMANELNPDIYHRENYYEEINNFNYFPWKNGKKVLPGYQPTISKEMEENFFAHNYTIFTAENNPVFMKNKDILSAKYMIDPLINFDANIKIVGNVFWIPFSVSVSLRMMLLNEQIFFPFKYFDIKNQKMTDHYFNMISYFNVI